MYYVHRALHAQRIHYVANYIPTFMCEQNFTILNL